MCTWSGKSLVIHDVDLSFDTTCTNTGYTGPITFNPIVKVLLHDKLLASTPWATVLYIIHYK